VSICCAEGFFEKISRPWPKTSFSLSILLVLVILSACRNPIDTSSLNSLAKTDIDMIADTSQREMNRLMEELLEKLYRRNPHELDKTSGMSIGQRQTQIFDTPGRLIFKELDNKQGTAALNLAFHPNYQGDRVFALMAGLVGMVRSAYNWQDEQFMFDSLNAQELFNCARNIEVLAWRLSHSRDASGKLLLLSNSQPGEQENLSYERIFGKMIAIQDMMAFTVAGKWERGINSVVKNAVFLPMGI
jgi:hypothetical protein